LSSDERSLRNGSSSASRACIRDDDSYRSDVMSRLIQVNRASRQDPENLAILVRLACRNRTDGTLPQRVTLGFAKYPFAQMGVCEFR
jgi:hypothetical protein